MLYWIGYTINCLVLLNWIRYSTNYYSMPLINCIEIQLLKSMQLLQYHSLSLPLPPTPPHVTHNSEAFIGIVWSVYAVGYFYLNWCVLCGEEACGVCIEEVRTFLLQRALERRRTEKNEKQGVLTLTCIIREPDECRADSELFCRTVFRAFFIYRMWLRRQLCFYKTISNIRAL